MNQLEHIQTEIASLPKQDFVKLREWIETMDWDERDRQIASKLKKSLSRGYIYVI